MGCPVSPRLLGVVFAQCFQALPDKLSQLSSSFPPPCHLVPDGRIEDDELSAYGGKISNVMLIRCEASRMLLYAPLVAAFYFCNRNRCLSRRRFLGGEAAPEFPPLCLVPPRLMGQTHHTLISRDLCVPRTPSVSRYEAHFTFGCVMAVGVMTREMRIVKDLYKMDAATLAPGARGSKRRRGSRAWGSREKMRGI
ncbi:hypothetical protein B0H19DRAFT_546710 [Mycena capillaripes]|nr:hypothetical protein B0H19DRAFT_546710 [Mycena capillaripes]